MTSGLVALVTGAGSGIGQAIALRLAKDGYNIALNDIEHHDGLESIEKEIRIMGREVIECIADVSKEEEVKNMINSTVEKLGSLDVMVANAGICLTKPFLESTLEDWDKCFNINAKGVFLCYKHAAVRMIEQGRGGRIIGASSIAGKQGSDLLSIYSATKFTVRSLTQSAAMALAPYGITVNAYAPGAVETPMYEKLREDFKFHGSSRLDELATGTPEEIAALVAYLASKEARYTTGQSININGGRFVE
ncbi:NAD(P)-binding protein [Macrolepiota fuliginosa MF-IS2]|uniref:3-oxoacyl-[acyl-carrier-protein] reductase n=1 Tax=Macrolepiota fuliginosa MF-IS2 TaxID=1400762 RepID=A0A9P5XCJ4_9AGAR|nr:NAD(P)-binding protein [Macrolepiota fuliginosa MF-IS2]